MWVTMMKKICDHGNKVIFINEISDGTEIFGMTQLKRQTLITNLSKKAKFSYSKWCVSEIRSFMCIKLD